MNLLIHAMLNLKMRTLANIYEIFQNIYHIDLLYNLRNGVGSLFVGRSYTCLAFQAAPGNVLYHDNRNLTGHFKFLDDSRMICLPFNIFKKLY